MKQKDVIGWAGVLLILAAFTLTTFGIINVKDVAYGVLNFFGALGIIISSYTKKDFQPVILNAIWLLVAVVGIIRSLI
jgi:branched-subunit amino acid ABC-type transport system permease component